MKVIVTDKGEGCLTVKFLAASEIEKQILAQCSMGEDSTFCSLNSVPSYDPAKPPTSKVHLGSCAFPVHEILEDKK